MPLIKSADINDAVYYAAYPIIEWAQADSDHPYNNFGNASVRGKATVMLPANDEAWLLGSFAAMVTGADINVAFRYMMSTSDTDPVYWGLAYAVGNQDLCAVPWEAESDYAEGDRVCPTVPNGCWYYVDSGNSGTSDSSEPTWPTTQDQTVVDNGVAWTCGGTDNYNTISLTGETAPSTAWDEDTKQFALNGTSITSGDLVRLLVIRKVDPPTSYWAKQDLSAATVTVQPSSGGTAPTSPSTIAGLYDGTYNDSNWSYAENCVWQSAYNGGTIGAYAQVQFSSVKTITRIIVQQAVSVHYATTSLKIQYSTDGSTWNDLETFAAAFGQNVLDISSPVSATHYRVVCNANTHQWDSLYRMWALGEIEFYTYETNPGSGHQGDMYLIHATYQAVEV